MSRFLVQRRHPVSKTWRTLYETSDIADAKSTQRELETDFDPGERAGRYYDYRIIDTHKIFNIGEE